MTCLISLTIFICFSSILSSSTLICSVSSCGVSASSARSRMTSLSALTIDPGFSTMSSVRLWSPFIFRKRSSKSSTMGSSPRTSSKKGSSSATSVLLSGCACKDLVLAGARRKLRTAMAAPAAQAARRATRPEWLPVALFACRLAAQAGRWRCNACTFGATLLLGTAKAVAASILSARCAPSSARAAADPTLELWHDCLLALIT
mmetsp:Transcript_11894/g.27732  ORF Transcript_11894/g.27732 Transcript_11894/m.27732 type:complete len:204 (+) Transcript_11894:760-1371(+)